MKIKLVGEDGKKIENEVYKENQDGVEMEMYNMEEQIRELERD